MMFGALTALTISLIWAGQFFGGSIPSLPGLLNVDLAERPSGPEHRAIIVDPAADAARDIRIEVDVIRDEARKIKREIKREIRIRHHHDARHEHKHERKRKRCRKRDFTAPTVPTAPTPPIPPNSPDTSGICKGTGTSCSAASRTGLLIVGISIAVP